MSILGWGSAWGNFGWGGTSGGQHYRPVTHVFVESLPVSSARVDITVDSGLLVEPISDYELAISLFTEELPVELANSAVATPNLSSDLVVTSEPISTYTYELTGVSDLEVRPICINRPNIRPLLGLETEVPPVSSVNIRPSTETFSIEATNDAIAYRTVRPNVGLEVIASDISTYGVELFLSSDLEVQVIPVSTFYGWACDDDRTDTDFNTPSKDSSSWNTINNRLTDFIDTSRGSTNWDSSTKRETVYNG